LAVGCGTKIKVDVDLNGTTGDALVDAFFARGVVEDQLFFENEDFDGDGNLDVDEDVDLDFNLDVDEDLNDNGILDANEVDVDGDGNLDLVNEDLDGDGSLDFINEDINGNGVLDENAIVDLNEDGVSDENDIATFSALFIIASSGEVSCDAAAEAVANEDDVLLDGTVLNTIVLQSTIGGGPNALVEGATIEGIDEDFNEIFSFSLFGEFQNGDEVIFAFSDNDTLTINQLSDTLSFDLTTTLFDENDNEFPLTASLKNVVECEALSDELQKIVEAGDL
jgi:hypothetical protein